MRRLPHLLRDGATYFVTWHLDGSLPQERYPPPGKKNSGAAFVWMDRYLDSTRNGPMWLGNQAHRPDCRRVAQRFSYYVIMPNHVHALLTPDVPLPLAMQHIKGKSAREANKILGVLGKPFWQRESYDHMVRSAEEFSKIQRYIENNAVKAGLSSTADSYRWSSAWSGWRELQLAATASAGGSALT